jgi:uncharacterized protein YegL
MMSQYTHHETDDSADIQMALVASGVQRTPCILVLDTSGSMSASGRIERLNEGLKLFESTIREDETLCQQVLLMVIGFGSSASMLCNWTQGDSFAAPTLEASGMTAMGEAMRVALAAVEEIRQDLKTRGIPYTRPWIFLMSDGGPNDEGWQSAAAESRKACEDRRVTVWPIAVPPNADAAALKAFARSDMNVYSLGEDANFGAIFEWLATSLAAVSQSSSGQKMEIDAPTRLVIDV